MPLLKTLIGIALIFCMSMFFSTRSEAERIRMPAEWEPQAATWMQWPGPSEKQLRPVFADIIRSVQKYQPVHLIAPSTAAQRDALAFLKRARVPTRNVTWHIRPTDNSWMRDNGPIYLTDGRETWIQDWTFDAWGGNFGPDVGHSNDDRVPAYVGGYLSLHVEDRSGYVLEKGNVETNGAGVFLLNFDCQDQRNPGLTRQEHEQILKEAFGATQIIWAYGHDPEDGTTGHIDGIARFINRNTVVISDSGQETEALLAEDLKREGYDVLWYPGDPNWLVGNGFVLANGEGDPAFEAELRDYLQRFFPGRDVLLINALAVNEAGGGIHCLTNDQPRL